jgi:hypothetical protein
MDIVSVFCCRAQLGVSGSLLLVERNGEPGE